MTTQGTTATADLNSPVFMIEHLAQMFGVRIDSAREYTYRSDFPPARDLGARLLWDREEILAWFRSLPKRTTADRTRNPAGVTPAVAAAPHSTYKPRTARRTQAAA